MNRSRMRVFVVSLAAAGLAVVGCDPLPRHALVSAIVDPQNAIEHHLGLVAKSTLPVKRVSTRKPNPDGRVLILEYHKLSRRNTQLDRPPAKFKQDLEQLYKLGYRPVTVNEWLEDKMNLPPGASPVLMTFDDAHPSQLKFKKDGSLDPNCFVAIWKQFAESHPDFPVHATFFILPPWPFGQAKFGKDKIQMLQNMGSEIDCHTYHHLNLAKCDDDTVKKEIATALDWLQSEYGIANVNLAFPYGNKPKNMDILKGFEYNGKQYHLRASFLAAGNPSVPVTAKEFDRWVIPRVVVCDTEGGSTSWIKDMQTSTKFAPYVAP